MTPEQSQTADRPLEGIPESYRDAAEEVRAHLVALRGGAPFLSSSEALLLVEWLDAGVSVGRILRALERAVDARRKRPSRTPLRLTLAKRHLDRPTRGILPAPPSSGHPLQALADQVPVLATQLLSLEGDLVRGGLSVFRDFFEAQWTSLTEEERAHRLGRAAEEMSELVGLLDEADLRRAAEELARDQLRREYPHLTAATLWDLVEGT